MKAIKTGFKYSTGRDILENDECKLNLDCPINPHQFTHYKVKKQGPLYFLYAIGHTYKEIDDHPKELESELKIFNVIHVKSDFKLNKFIRFKNWLVTELGFLRLKKPLQKYGNIPQIPFSKKMPLPPPIIENHVRFKTEIIVSDLKNLNQKMDDFLNKLKNEPINISFSSKPIGPDEDYQITFVVIITYRILITNDNVPRGTSN